MGTADEHGETPLTQVEDATTAMGTVPALLGGVRVAGLDGLILLATVVVAAIAVSSGRRAASRDRARPAKRTDGLRRSLDRLGSVPVGAALGGGVALVVAGQRSLAGPALTAVGVVVWMAGLAVVVALDRRQAHTPSGAGGDTASEEGQPAARPAGSTAVRNAILVGAALAGVFVWTENRARPLAAGRGDVVVAWALSMVGVTLAAGWPWGDRITGVWARFRSARREVAILAAVTLVALAPRVVALSSYPWRMSGDEGEFARWGIAVLEGEVRNPFATGWFSHPTLYFFLEAGTMEAFGRTVAGSRVPAALLGTAAVLATYLAARPHLGRLTAVVAAALLAGFHVHLYWSRSSLNNVADSLFVVVAIWLLDRGLLGGRRLSAALAGISIGLAQYFFFGARVLPALAGAYVVAAIVCDRRWSPAAIRRAIERVAPLAGWVAAGATVAVLPLAAFAVDHRATFFARTDEVSIFASGWIASERRITGQGTAEILGRQLVDVALLPFHTRPEGFYRGEPPFVGWPYALPVAIGLAIATVGLRERRYLGWAVSYWIVVVGVAMTAGPPQTNRLVMTTPALCVFAAIGLVAVARLAARPLQASPAAMAAAALVAAAGICGWSLHLYFHDPTQPERYSDPNTEVANLMAHEARALGPDVTVYFAGSPRMRYEGFSNIAIIAPEAEGIDVDTPWGPPSPRPTIGGPTLFVFLPERRAELDVVRAWFPDGTVTEYATEEGAPLFTSYLVEAR